MGHPVVKTPNMDRVAQHGVIFNNTYCGNPVCAPSRAGMVSGVYPSDCNSFCNSTAWDGSLPAWPRPLRDAGYQTFGTGKMDTNDKFDLGFDEAPNLANGHWKNPDITAFFRRPLCFRPGERRQVDGRSRAERHKDGKLADATVKFIRSHAKSDRPWAAYCGPHMPHPSFVGLKDYFDYYVQHADLPEVSGEELEQQHDVYKQLRNFKDIATTIPTERIRRARAGYYAMIQEVDDYVGRIWNALEETGQLENTIFVYTSDHGESLGDHGLWLKNNLYDVAARVPLVMAGPGLPKGKTVDTPVGHVDLIRTFLEVGAAKTHDKLRGHSLLPLANGTTGDHPGWAYCESHSEGNTTGSFMVRKGDWKYIHFSYYPTGLLYNVADDPGERHNRFDDPAAAGKLKELQDLLHAQVDTVELTERAFRLQRKRMDEMAAKLDQNGMLDEFRNRLGEGQAVTLLTGYYGKPFKYEHKPEKDNAD
jgi:choline-sulfatase